MQNSQLLPLSHINNHLAEHLGTWNFFFGDDEEEFVDDSGVANQLTFRCKRIRRDRIGADMRLYIDYLAPETLYTNKMFQRRFQINKDLFQKICSDLQEHNPYWVQRSVSSK